VAHISFPQVRELEEGWEEVEVAEEDVVEDEVARNSS